MKHMTLIEYRDILNKLMEDGVDPDTVLVAEFNYETETFIGNVYPPSHIKMLAYNDSTGTFYENPKDKSRLMKVLQIC